MLALFQDSVTECLSLSFPNYSASCFVFLGQPNVFLGGISLHLILSLSPHLSHFVHVWVLLSFPTLAIFSYGLRRTEIYVDFSIFYLLSGSCLLDWDTDRVSSLKI